MTRKLTLLALFTFLTISLFAKGPVADTLSASLKGTMEQQILYYTNQFRASNGLAPLQMEAFSSRLAWGHSRNMATGVAAFGHENFEERCDALRLELGTVSACAENVAMGTLDAKGVVDGWIKSPGHRKNMLGDFNTIGIGSYRKGNSNILYFTQLFSKREPTAAKKKKK
jgi:uncharacterized protein YkwD